MHGENGNRFELYSLSHNNENDPEIIVSKDRKMMIMSDRRNSETMCSMITSAICTRNLRIAKIIWVITPIIMILSSEDVCPSR